MDCSPSGSSVHGISPARILEGVAMSSSRGPSHPGIKPISCISCTGRQSLFHFDTWEAQISAPGASLAITNYYCRKTACQSNKKKKRGRKKGREGKSLAVQWLGLCTFTAQGLTSTSGWGSEIPQDRQCRPKKESRKRTGKPALPGPLSPLGPWAAHSKSIRYTSGSCPIACKEKGGALGKVS